MEHEEDAPKEENDENEPPITSQVLEYYNNHSYMQPNRLSEEKVPDVIVENADDNIRDPSPASSITSNRKLEWDNGADIGYDNCDNSKTLHKSHSFPLLTSHTTQFDIKANVEPQNLKKSNSGSEVEKCSISSTPTVANIAKYTSSSSSLFCNEDKNISTDSDSSNEDKAGSKNILQFIKQKVGSPVAKSTPISRFAISSSNENTSEDSNKNKEKILNQLLANSNKIISLCVTKPVIVECRDEITPSCDKISQTTLVKNSAKSVQTESFKNKQVQPHSVLFVKHSDSDKDDLLDSPLVQTDSDVISNCNSFEYHYGDDYNENLNKDQSDGDKKVPSTQDVNGLKRSKAKSDLTNVSSSKSTLSKNATSNSSESTRNGSSKSSPLGKLISKPQSENLMEDIERSVNLLQMLMKSKNYDDVTKKHYLKKIVQKIVNTKYADDKENLKDNDKPKLEDNVPWIPAHSTMQDNEPIIPIETNRYQLDLQTEKFYQNPHLKRSKFTLPSSGTDNSNTSSSSIKGQYNLPQKHFEPQTSTSDNSLGRSAQLKRTWKDAKTKSEILLENKQSSGDSNGVTAKDGGLLDYANKEREHQLSWINNEIVYLSKLKELLQKHCKSEEGVINAILQKSYDKTVKDVKKSTTVYMITTESTKNRCTCGRLPKNSNCRNCRSRSDLQSNTVHFNAMKNEDKGNVIHCPNFTNAPGTSYSIERKRDVSETRPSEVRPKKLPAKLSEQTNALANQRSRILRRCFCGSYTYPPASSSKLKPNCTCSGGNTKDFDCKNCTVRLSQMGGFPVDIKNARLISEQSYQTQADGSCGKCKASIQRYCFEIPIPEAEQSSNEILDDKVTTDSSLKNIYCNTEATKTLKCKASVSSKGTYCTTSNNAFYDSDFSHKDYNKKFNQEHKRDKSTLVTNKSITPKTICLCKTTQTDEVCLDDQNVNSRFNQKQIIHADCMNQCVNTQFNQEQILQTDSVNMVDKCQCTCDLTRDQNTSVSNAAIRPKTICLCQTSKTICLCKTSQTDKISSEDKSIFTDGNKNVFTSTRINKLKPKSVDACVGMLEEKVCTYIVNHKSFQTEAAPVVICNNTVSETHRSPVQVLDIDKSTSITTTSSTESTSSSNNEIVLRFCSCCKKNLPPASPYLEQKQESGYVLCHPCHQQNQMHGQANFLQPGHQCKCYNTVRQDTVKKIQDTIKELELLEACEDYCKCVCSKNCNNSKYCSHCKCKLKDAGQNANGIAYMITLESEKINSNDQRTEVDVEPRSLQEIKIKIPSLSTKKKHKEEENRKKSSRKGKVDAGESRSKHKSSKKRNPTLQEYLQQNKPGFIESAEERRKCLLDLAYMREERCQKYKQLLALTSGLTVPPKFMDNNFKPKRMFTSKEMKQITEKNYKKLPEVQQKLLDERDRRIKQANRLLADIFNKKLRENVLKGKRTLSPSVSIITLT